MNDKIEIGDTVRLRWNVNTGSTGGPFRVLHTPADSGDMWRLVDLSGGIYYVNPSASSLDMIELVKKERRKE